MSETKTNKMQNKENEEHEKKPLFKLVDNKTEMDLAQMFFCFLIVIAIFYITQSAYLQTYSYEMFIGVALLGVAFSKFTLSYRMPLWYIILLAILFVISSWLLVQGDDDYAWWGTALLIFTVVLDIAYVLYLKYSMKIEFSNITLYSTIVSGLAAAFLLGVSFF